MKINVYTDASFCDSLSFGCWGFYSPTTAEMYVGVIQARNANEVELYAAIMAATHFGKRDINIFSDSRYVVNGVYKMMREPKMKGLQRSDDLADKLYWLELMRMLTRNNINFIWIQAHKKHAGNHEIDRAVSNTMRKYKKLIQGGRNG